MLWSSLDLVHIFVSVFFAQLNSLHKARFGLTFQIASVRTHSLCMSATCVYHAFMTQTQYPHHVSRPHAKTKEDNQGPEQAGKTHLPLALSVLPIEL